MKRSTLSQTLAFGLVGLVLLASGCQTNPSPKSTGVDNTGFMSLWKTYTDCKAASDLSQASSATEKLAVATRLQGEDRGFVLLLPTKLERFVNSQPSRFAVDVQAMAAACALHTGQLALDQGRIDKARDMFASVVELHQEKTSYYVLKAKTFLTKLERGIDVSLNTP
ncbi:MAG: hypothetical protein HY038_00790 [Nitrospirae bacterium]|nr:hypothetical protein [Nitrospirota bacterium]